MTEQETRTVSRVDWLLIGLLVVLVLPLRLWLLHNTEVTARDSIGYIRYALQLEDPGKHKDKEKDKDWKDVLKENHQHPGYPVLVLLTSLPIRAIDGATTPENMALSTQLVSLVASLALLVPCYFLGLQLFDRKIAFLGALLFQYLPISAQHLSDGISEPFYLVLLVSALLQAVHAIRERSVWRCVWCGVFTGFAYLTRPEGLLILPAIGGVLILLQCRSEWRWGWQPFLSCGAAVTLSAMLVGSIYVYATGKITNKQSSEKLLGTYPTSSQAPASSMNGHRFLFAKMFQPSDSNAVQLQHSVMALLSEVNQGFHYAAGIPALLGLWWSFGLMRRDPGYWVVIGYGLLHSFILIALGLVVSYVSDRHVMILVLIGCYFAVYGLQELPKRILALFATQQSSDYAWYRRAPVWFAVFFVALIGLCLPKATQRLHGNRAENHAAGLWLAERLRESGGAQDNVNIVDDHGWSHFYSGLIFQEGREPAFAVDHPSKTYIVTTRVREGSVDPQRLTPKLNSDAEVVWPENGDVGKARVLVYAQRRVYHEYRWPVPKTQK